MEKITLRCADTETTIAPERGALVTSFRVRNRELLYLDEATFNDRSKNVRGGIPILFPSPGKLTNDRWEWSGKNGALGQHGFARALAWEVEFVAPTNATLRLNSSPQTLQHYPWAFEATLSYSLSERSLLIEFEVVNRSDSPMPFAFGLHPYFEVSDKAAVRIPSAATRAFDNVTKAIVPFTGFDLTQSEVDLHLLDHDGGRAMMQLGDGTTIALDASPDFNRWIVWSVAGKDYVCLEPWTASGNALNANEGLIVLRAGEKHALWVTLALEEPTR